MCKWRKWRIDVHLKSGKTLNCYVEDDHENSKDVAVAYFVGNDNEFRALTDTAKSKQIFYRLGDVSAFEIYIA